MWNAIEEVIRRFNTELKPVLELMSFGAQPKDADNAAVPMLWKFHARSFLELSAAMEFAFFHRNVPPPPIMKCYPPVTTHWVIVTQPTYMIVTRDAFIPKQTVVHTEACPPVSPAFTARPPVPVVAAEEPTYAILLSATIPPAETTPSGSYAGRTYSWDGSVDTPDRGRIPENSSWNDNGRGPRPVVEGSGSMTTCHLWGVGNISRKFGVRWYHSWLEGSEAHLYETERQKGWCHHCVVYNKQCLGLTAFEDHVCGKKHKKKVKLLGLDKEGYCLGQPHCRLQCCSLFPGLVFSTLVDIEQT